MRPMYTESEGEEREKKKEEEEERHHSNEIKTGRKVVLAVTSCPRWKRGFWPRQNNDVPLSNAVLRHHE